MNFLKVQSYRSISDLGYILYLVFLWQIPYSWRLIIIPSLGKQGVFNEYMDVSIYLGEVFLICALLINILQHLYLHKSTILYFKKIKFHVKLIYFLVFVYLFINIFHSTNLLLSLTSIFHLINIAIFIFITYQYYVTRETFFIKDVFKILSFSIFIQFIISILQLFYGSSVGVYFLNESHISLITNNVAKSNIFDHTIIRSYGTFSHPNVLAGYSFFCILFFLKYSVKFHVKLHRMKALLFTILCIFLSQSKILIFLLIFSYGIFFYKKSMFHMKQKTFLIGNLMLFVLILLNFGLFFSDISKSFYTRFDQFKYQINYNKISFFGSGIGTYRINYDQLVIPFWFLEPIHNVLIIYFYEMGIIGSLLLLLTTYWYVSRGTKHFCRIDFLITIFILFMLIFDHYAWDIFQGQYLIASSILLKELT